MPWTFLRQLSFGQSIEGGARSTVVKSLLSMFLILIAALIGGVYAGIPQFILDVFTYFLMIDFGVFILAYIYFALTDKDSLRSENFVIKKMAIEHGLRGDSSTGLLEEIPGDASLPSSLRSALPMLPTRESADSTEERS